jgi:predicted transposase YbfD/YdcC
MQNWQEIVDWAKQNEDWLKRFLSLPSGIPSHDTFGRVFSIINPESFQVAFKKWVEELNLNFPSRETIAIDGKFLVGSKQTSSSRSALMIVSAWACETGISLGQISSRLKKEEGEKKSMEKLIDQIDVKGNIITIDAGGATPTIIKKITDREGDVVVGLKDNQKMTKNLAKNLFLDKKNNKNILTKEFQERSHGREEKRVFSLLPIANAAHSGLIPTFKNVQNKWPSIKSYGKVILSRKVNGVETIEERYFLSTLTNIDEFSHSTRSHWKIENHLHWQLDVTFREDNNRVRIGYAAENLASIRRLALSLLKKELSEKRSMKRKQLLCNWDKDYLLKVIRGAI